jgi:hypothetical protein
MVKNQELMGFFFLFFLLLSNMYLAESRVFFLIFLISKIWKIDFSKKKIEFPLEKIENSNFFVYKW